jgi:predicted transcriptional regulator
MAAKDKTLAEVGSLRVNEKKWGKLLMKTGWTAIPNVILEKQKALGLKAIDVNILLHLAMYWWEAGSPPYPGKKTIAQAIGVVPRTVQRRIAAMEKKGLLRRQERRTPGGSKTNLYHFEGLIKKTTPHAREALEERQKRRLSKNARLRRRKPLLQAVE